MAAVLRGVLLRFVAGSAAVLVPAVGAVALLASDHLTGAALLSLVAELLGLTAGFAAVLGPGGAKLRLGSGPGFRSFMAGVLAPICAGGCSWLVPAAGLGAIAVLSALAGALAGLLVLVEGQVVRPRLARAGG